MCLFGFSQYRIVAAEELMYGDWNTNSVRPDRWIGHKNNHCRLLFFWFRHVQKCGTYVWQDTLGLGSTVIVDQAKHTFTYITVLSGNKLLRLQQVAEILILNFGKLPQSVQDFLWRSHGLIGVQTQRYQTDNRPTTNRVSLSGSKMLTKPNNWKKPSIWEYFGL